MKLLLHMCCGPCAVYPVSVIREEGIEFEGLFFNPNIHPKEELLRRKENVEKLAAIKDIKVNYNDEFRQKDWENYDNTNISRCNMCYTTRIEEAAKTAAIKGFNAFSTTLLVSPYQNHDLIKMLGEKYALEYGVEFYYKDFRPGFRKGQQEAKDIGLYRQKYCGCIISLSESNGNKK
ncbi:epoxyqueuosine reductase QueH [Acetivibrio cellulolyticus]|uniref:epoxyqueuosine reductase QueH n=1 Tax=Acetivibrio cellulolyticus TaxID=35830 RepID=UPI0001E2E77B|nr:epoxyqueuosine reductase QueH [Acetivibrio cellulolyticus]